MNIGSFNMNLSSSFMNMRQREISIRVKNETDINTNLKDGDEGLTQGVEATNNNSKLLTNSIDFHKDVISKSLGELLQFRQDYHKDSALYMQKDKYITADDNGVLANNRHQLEVNDETKSADTVAVNMKGVFNTEEGKEVSFDIQLNLSNNFIGKNDLDLEIRDPLVINFDAPSVGLSDSKFEFDIDNDGEIDQISNLKQGSGFLALDKNGDGTINDGSELFGTESGNGFRDLDIYDEDGNGWIDENDSIFESLRVWKKSDTQDELVALGEVGVGAIYLGYTASPFEIKSESDTSTLGIITSTGLFAKENGDIGTMQNINLAKSNQKDELEEAIDYTMDVVDSYVLTQTGGTVTEVERKKYEATESNYESVTRVTDNSKSIKESGYVSRLATEELTVTEKVAKIDKGVMNIDIQQDVEVITNDNGDKSTEDSQENSKQKNKVVTADEELVQKSEELNEMQESVDRAFSVADESNNVIDQIEEETKNSELDEQKSQKIEELKVKQSKVEAEVTRLQSLKTGVSIQDNYIDIQIAKANKEIAQLKMDQTNIETQNFLSYT
jgi:hypothetical protein